MSCEAHRLTSAGNETKKEKEEKKTKNYWTLVL
jgi:hypothetical protein